MAVFFVKIHNIKYYEIQIYASNSYLQDKNNN